MVYGCYSESEDIVNYCDFFKGNDSVSPETLGFLAIRGANLHKEFSNQHMLVDENTYDF